LNFSLTKEETTILMVASAKGKEEIVELILKNKTILAQKTDVFGVNAFWIACFYGNIPVM
jgi:ankyrin repeat protein